MSDRVTVQADTIKELRARIKELESWEDIVAYRRLKKKADALALENRTLLAQILSYREWIREVEISCGQVLETVSTTKAVDL